MLGASVFYWDHVIVWLLGRLRQEGHCPTAWQHSETLTRKEEREREREKGEKQGREGIRDERIIEITRPVLYIL